MRTRPLFLFAILAGAVALILAAGILRPSAPPEPPPAIEEAAAPERPALRHRLEDAGWRLAESRDKSPSRRIDPPLAMIGGVALSEAPSWFAIVEAIHPPSARITAESRSSCSATLFQGGVILTAAHCFPSEVSRVEVKVQPRGRMHGRASYSVGRWAEDARFEPDGRGNHGDDRALIFLPEDPGGGLPLPQDMQAVLEKGERIRIFGMGDDGSGRLSEQVFSCDQTITDVRLTVVEALGDDCRFADGDSGGVLALVMPDGRIVPKGNISHRLQGAEHRQFYAPLDPPKMRKAMEAVSGS